MIRTLDTEAGTFTLDLDMRTGHGTVYLQVPGTNYGDGIATLQVSNEADGHATVWMTPPVGQRPRPVPASPTGPDEALAVVAREHARLAR